MSFVYTFSINITGKTHAFSTLTTYSLLWTYFLYLHMNHMFYAVKIILMLGKVLEYLLDHVSYLYSLYRVRLFVQQERHKSEKQRFADNFRIRCVKLLMLTHIHVYSKW